MIFFSILGSNCVVKDYSDEGIVLYDFTDNEVHGEDEIEPGTMVNSTTVT